MKIIVCSKRDLTSVVLLNDLFARLAELPGCRIALWLAERTRTVETAVPELVRMKFLERDLPFRILFPLIDTNPAAGGGALLTIEGLLARHAVPCRIVTSMKAPETLAAIDEFAPDLILSVRYSFVFRPEIIARPRFGIVNVHPGALPDYAGLYPHFHSMLAGEPAVGCSVHQVDDGIDSGPLLATGAVPIDPSRSAWRHNLDSHLLGNRLVVEIVRALAAGEVLRGVAQADPGPIHRTYPTREEFDRFRDRGLSLVKEIEYIDLLAQFMGPMAGRAAADALAPVRTAVAEAMAAVG
jgi:methionyl-tRNA formyltransferase